MPEHVEEEVTTSAPSDPERYLDLIRRRHVPFLLALLFGWLMVFGGSWIIPPHYKSTTLILVQRPSMPKDYVTPNVSDNVQDRMASITQQILSRTRLLTIIGNLHLYQDEKTRLAPDSCCRDFKFSLINNSVRRRVTACAVCGSPAEKLTLNAVI